jgi:subtilisin family serine protease
MSARGTMGSMAARAESTASRPVLAGEPMFDVLPDGTYGVVRESRTASLALDRITRRQPSLNGTVRRAGTGRGVTIYVFDGGVAEDHPELAGRVRIGYDAFPSRPRVCNAHGTAVAGAAAGATLGTAPEAQIVDVKIINCERQHGSIEAIVAAARWTVEDHQRHPGPAVANWSFVVDTLHLQPAIDSAVALLRDAGILVVAAAGNFDIDACRVSPANARGVLVVGASGLSAAGDKTVRDVRAAGTAWGSCVDIYAPGDSVLLPTIETGRSATIWSGTSMAAGYVSGAASLILERDAATPPDALLELLTRRATPNAIGRLLYVGPS